MQLFVRTFALLIFLALPAQVFAQQADIEGVEAAIARGDAQALTALCANRVDVTLNGATTTYSRAQVQYVLAGFFESNPPESFAFEHQMSAGEGATFASGRYHTPGRTFQVMARMSRKESVWELRELRIEN